MPGVALVLEAAAETGEQRSAASMLLQGGGADADVALQAPQVQTRTQNRRDVVLLNSSAGPCACPLRAWSAARRWPAC